MQHRIILRYMKIQPNYLTKMLYIAEQGDQEFDYFDEAKDFVRANGITNAIVFDDTGHTELFDGHDWAPLVLAKRIN